MYTPVAQRNSTPTTGYVPVAQRTAAPAQPQVKVVQPPQTQTISGVVQAQPTQKITGVVQAKPTQTISGVTDAQGNPTKPSYVFSDQPVSTSLNQSSTPESFALRQATPDDIAYQERSKTQIVTDLLKAPIKDLIVMPGVRIAQVIASPFNPSAGEKDVNIKIPGLGSYDVKAQKTGVAGVKQVVGQGLTAASWLYMPEKVVGIGRNILNDVALEGIKAGTPITDALVRDAFWNVVKKSAAQGAIIGSAGNLGASLQEDKTWTDNGKDFVIGGVFGGVLGAGLGAGGAGLMIAKNKVGFVQNQLMQELINRGLTPEHAQSLVSEGGYLGNILSKINPKGEELGLKVNELNKRWVENPTPANKKALDAATKEYKMATQGGYVKNPFASETPGIQPELGSQKAGTLQSSELSKGENLSYDKSLTQPGDYVKERGFMTSLKENSETQVIFKDVVDNYNPHVNADDIATVRAMSIMEPEKYGMLVRSTDNSAESTIAKVMYLKDSIKAGNISEAKVMATALAKRGTELGQAVQAYRTLGSDLGNSANALVLAQKEFEKAKIPLTDEIAGKVIKQSEFIGQLPKTAKYEKFKQTQNLLKIISDNLPTQPGEVIKQLLNIPRTLMSSFFDLSFGFRQGLVAAFRHPQEFASAFKGQFKMFALEKAYEDAMNIVMNHPDYEYAKKAGISFTDLGSKMTSREEQYMSSYAERIPLIGKGVRMTSRAYTGMANKLRMDVFSSLMNDAEKIGLNPRTDEKMATDLARLVNDITGRGTLGKYENAAPLLNAVFFSPRLMTSRIGLLTNPISYMKAEPFVRKEALKSMLAFGSGIMTILGLAKLSGLNVGADPRSADFGKIKIGNTRLDVMGGFQQYLRMAGQIISGKYISSTTGKEYSLGEGYKPMTRLDIVARQFESKEAPVISFVADWLRGTDTTGAKFTLGSAIQKRLTPMIIQDVTDLYNDDPNLLPLGLLGSFGVGLQTYNQPKTSVIGGGLPQLPKIGGGLPKLPKIKK